MIVRRRVISAALVLLAAAGCGDRTGATSSEETSSEGLLGRTFLSESVTEDGAPRDLVEGTRISLEFGEDGQLVALAGCNHLLADVTVRDDRLEITGVGSTEMGCDEERHEQDQWLSGFLSSSPAWALDGDRLTLTSGATEIVLLDRRVADPDRPLEGTRWLVTTIVTGEAASSLPAGTEGSAWLVIEGEGFTAHTGCREITGGVDVGNETLRFFDVVQTDQACAPEHEQVDEVMGTILGGGADVEYYIEAAGLRLDHPDGVGLGLHADE